MDLKRRIVLARMAGGAIGLALLEKPSHAVAANESAMAPAQLEALASGNFNAKSFGARGNGNADDTASLQKWINFLVGNCKRGTLSAGEYRISEPLNVPSGYEWAIDGDLAGSTRIVQTSDNMPILNIGATGNKPLIHTWRISDLEFDYANNQPASNEHANPIVFSQMACEFSLTRLRFARGSYAIKVKPGIGGPWGGSWDELVFESGLSAGAMDWTGCVNGVPNNKWGRFFVDCHNMDGPVFKNVRGYNWVIDTIEFIAAQRGAQLFSIVAGSMATFGAIKLENGVYRSAVNLIDIGTGAHVRIGQLHIGGNAMILHPHTGALTLLATGSGGPTGSFELDTLVASATEFGGNVFVISGAKGPMRIQDMTFDKYPWQICDNTTTQTGDSLTLDQYKNDRISSNLGDTNYAVVLGDPNTLSFESPLSEPRTLDLPSSANQLFNGLYYEIRLYGAVNGLNTLTIRSSGTIKFVAKTDKVVIRFAWRRGSSPAGNWLMTAYDPLP